MNKLDWRLAADLDKRPLSYSSLKHFARSPIHFVQHRLAEIERRPELIFGGMFHCLLLQPEKFDEYFAIMPDVNLRTKEGKAIMAEFEVANLGKQLVTQSDYNNAKIMAEAIKDNPVASKYLSGCEEFEKRLEWTDKKTDLKQIAYLDGIGAIGHDNYVLEIKTTTDATPDKFQRDAFNYMYYLQAAMYVQALSRYRLFPRLVYIVIEKAAPFGISVFTVDDDFINYGKQMHRKLLDHFRYCLDNELFEEDYRYYGLIGKGTHTLDLPYWAKKKIEDF